MHKTIKVSTNKRNGLYDITNEVRKVIKASEIDNGLVNVYVRHATAAIMIQENWDESVQNDVVSLLSRLIPKGVWEHDAQDGNGDAHLKSGLVGPSQTIPLIDGELALGRWQNIFLCEFDGPRSDRQVVITIIADRE
ncbi:MAG TPA: secondary thiamine-phosphate synthase enzyme YjbQ [Acidobacteriota bacterium]|nr:secondary thiamine-phosphate synthase enzyme YjbQ [Acidobacteriota bacterium]